MKAAARSAAPLRISFLYALFGVLWILLGDMSLVRDTVPFATLTVGLAKGILFVLISSILIYFLVRTAVMRRDRLAGELDAVLETAPLAIVALDADDVVRAWNGAATRLLGWTEDDVIGRAVTQLGLDAVALDASGPHDAQVMTRSGATIDVRVFSSAPTAGVGTRVLMMRDRRPQRAVEDALRQAHKLEAVSRLAGGVAHEFNNVLTAIVGHTAMLSAACPPDDERQEHAEQIQRAAARATALTRQLLVFSGYHVMRPTLIDLTELLSGMQPMLAALSDTVRIEVTAGEGLWPVRCDVAQMQQLVVNLVVNACDAMPDGGTVRVRLDNAGENVMPEPGVPAGNWVRISVEDTGRGMDADTVARVFEPFFTTKNQRIGLGLATVYGIVQHCAGDIRVESEPGRGTRVAVYLPRARAEIPAAAATAARNTGVARLLVVEDDEAVRALTVRVLQRQGHDVLAAANAQEALALAHDNPGIQLVIADIVMPGMSGIELGERLRLSHPDVPILYTSGYAGGSVSDAGTLAAGTYFMEKPYEPYQLLSRIGELLARSGD